MEFYRNLLGLACCFILMENAEPQVTFPQRGNWQITPNFSNLGTRVTLEVDEGTIFPNTLNSVCAVTRALVGDQYDINSIALETRPDCCVDGKTGGSIDVEIYINPTTQRLTLSPSGQPDFDLLTCGIQVTASGQYRIAFRSFEDVTKATDSQADRVYVFNFDPNVVEAQNIPGVPLLVNIPPERCISIQRDTDARLQIVSESTGALLTGEIPLGENICLEAVYTTEPYNPGVDSAGLRVRQCTLSRVDSSAGALVVLGSNGCADGQIPSIPVNTGFVKTSLTLTGSRLEYRARLCFQAFQLSFVKQSILTCQVDYCQVATDTATPGSCGGNHCDPSGNRKRRSVGIQENATTISVAFPPSQKTKPCSESLIFKISVASLGSTAIVLLIAILVCMADTRRRQRLSEKATEKTLDSKSISTATSVLYSESLGFSAKC